MVGPLFTAFAMIAAGRIEIPPAPPQPAPAPHVRGVLPEESGKGDRSRRRR
jgi:hypothetical protein